jgi:membrane protease YdiL (CAAX protease family)
MKANTIFQPFLFVLWGVILVWSVVLANNSLYPILLLQFSDASSYVKDLLSDAVLLFVASVPAIWAPRFFGYRLGTISKHWKLLVGMAAFFLGAPLLYRLIAGETPFGENTWFFEGIVVPLAEEGFFRGILFSVLLWGFDRRFDAMKTGWLALVSSTLIFSTAHLNNLGNYPTGFVLFQVGFSTVVGFGFGYTRLLTGSIYPAMLLHALFNVAGTL